MQAAMQLWTGEQAMPDAKEYAHKYARRCGEKDQEHILHPIQQDSILCRLIALWHAAHGLLSGKPTESSPA